MPVLQNKIPLNKQDARAIGGLDIWHLTYEESFSHANKLNDHRDDYYVLCILIKGQGVLHCDMEDIKVSSKSIFLVKPYQVHSGTEISKSAEAYFISIAPFLMPDRCSHIFQNLNTAQQYLRIPQAHNRSIIATADLLCKAFNEESFYKTFIINSLFNALILRVAALFSDLEKKHSQPQNQSYIIAQKFKQLVSDYNFLHSPAFFAEKLSITTSHLNDCVKTITGLSVTNFLQEAMLLEAKRNLYYTNDDVKKIAYTLGFEDHTYFSRLFKKLAGETPLSFRNKFRG